MHLAGWLLAVASVVPLPSTESVLILEARPDVVVEGRFGAGGITAQLELSKPADPRLPTTARVLTHECQGQASTLPPYDPVQPLTVVDLDADGRDEVFVLDRGNTIQDAFVLRVDGCRVTPVLAEGNPSDDGELPFQASGSMGSWGLGVLCRRTSTGSVDVLTVSHGPWAEVDMSDPDHPVSKVHESVGWTRTTLVMRGDRLVKTAAETGVSRVHDDPTVPLLNSFDCLGSRYP
jgi:hypothetical protein